MQISVAVGYAWYWSTGALIRAFKLLFWSATIACILVLIFVLTAQSAHYGAMGNWRPVPNALLLDILKIDLPPAETDEFSNLIRVLLDLPATLTLLSIAIASFLMTRLTKALERRRRSHDLRGAHHRAMLKDIEEALAGRHG